jgi:four helix bundle protein
LTIHAARFYTIARGSTLECAAILDAVKTLGLVAAEALREPRELVERIVAMLTKLRQT